MSTGRFIAVVGPSGVGKDSVMEALIAAQPDFHRVRRVITRPSAAGGENFEGVSRDEFETRRDAGALPCAGPRMGVLRHPRLGAQNPVARGRCTGEPVAGAMLAAAEVFPGLHVLHITAAPDVLARRLAARGRETPEDIRARLAREVSLPEGLRVTEVDNGGRLQDSVEAALAALYPERGSGGSRGTGLVHLPPPAPDLRSGRAAAETGVNNLRRRSAMVSASSSRRPVSVR